MIASNPNHAQRLRMESLGFETADTEDSRRAVWRGYGLDLTLRVEDDPSHDDAMRTIIGAAQVAGKEAQQREAREAFRIITGLRF